DRSGSGAVREFPGDLVAMGIDLPIEAERRPPRPGLPAPESRCVQAEGREEGTEVASRGQPRPEEKPRAELVRASERELVLSRTIRRAIEAPPVPRRLVEDAQARRALGEDLRGDRGPLDGPGQRSPADHVPQPERRVDLADAERELRREDRLGI